MKAGEIMTLGAATVRPETSLGEAARLMVEHRISGLPVVDAAGKLVGMITERDFLRGDGGERPRWIAAILDRPPEEVASELEARRVEEAMSRDVVSVGSEASVGEIVDIMERRNVRRLPVVADGKVVGIVSAANLLLALRRRDAAAS